ncbi:MAG: GNAT family N-acetyltransferase, partial [Burkholderiaceae bacterium]|nr:GNAT family N-acetyltransferase [Burkholderiaceae bacterium]
GPVVDLDALYDALRSGRVAAAGLDVLPKEPADPDHKLIRAFLDRETGAFLGNGGLAQFERGIPELGGFPEAGWAFVPAAWGKGYATEAMGAIFNWAD